MSMRLFFGKHLGMPSVKPEPCRHRQQLGRNVARFRKDRAMTQESLAEKVGMSTRYFQSLEAGEYFPSLPKLVRLKTELSISWNELFGGCEDKSKG